MVLNRDQGRRYYRATATSEGLLSPAQFALVAQLRTDSGWAAPGLAANWANFGAGWANAGYKKDETGRVWLRGMIAKGIAVVAGETIFVLPAGFRPPATEYFAINSNGAFGTIWITAAGAVNLQIGNAAYVSLSNISFDTV